MRVKCGSTEKSFCFLRKQIHKISDVQSGEAATAAENFRKELQAVKVTAIVLGLFIVDYWPAVIAVLYNQFHGKYGYPKLHI